MTQRLIRDEDCLPQYFKDEPAKQKRIVVPEGMLKAACLTGWCEPYGSSSPFPPANAQELIADHAVASKQEVILPMLGAALRWLSENPIAPNGEQMAALNATAEGARLDPSFKTTRWYIVEWQRRMFLAPEPKKEAIPVAQTVDLLWKAHKGDAEGEERAEKHNEAVFEAYKRGLNVLEKGGKR